MERNYTNNSCRCISVHTINVYNYNNKNYRNNRQATDQLIKAVVDIERSIYNPIHCYGPSIAIARRYLNSVVLRLSRD